MVERHRIDFLIANRIRNPLFTKVSRDIYLPRQTEIPQPRQDVRPSEEFVGSPKKPGAYNVCTPCNNIISCKDIYSPNNPYTTLKNGKCPSGSASFFQLIESEGVTGDTGDTGDSSWCKSHTYCFQKEIDTSSPNENTYALVRAKATGQSIESISDGEKMGTLTLSDSENDYKIGRAHV